MATHSAVSTETYREKALRKFKQQPLVPVGATSPVYRFSSEAMRDGMHARMAG